MLGGDINVKSTRSRALDEGSNRLLTKNIGNSCISAFTGFNLLLKSTIGTDPFFVPYLMQGGIGTGIIVAIISALITQLSFQVYVFTWRFGNQFDYRPLWASIFGRNASWVPSLLLFFCYLSYLAEYAYEIWYSITDVAYVFTDSPPSFLEEHIFGSYVVSLLAMLLVCFSKKFATLKFHAYAANIAMVLTSLLIGVVFFLKLRSDGIDHPLNIWTFDSQLFQDTLGTYATIFFFHPFVQHVIVSMEQPRVSTCLKMTWSATFASLLINIFTGIVGYGAGPSSLEYDSILYYVEGYKWIMLAARIINLVTLLVSVGIYFFLCSYEVCELILENSFEKPVPRVCSQLVLVCFVALCNSVPEVFSEVLSALSHLSMIILAFVLPMAFYFKTYGLSRCRYTVFTLSVCVIGIIFELFVLTFSIASIAGHPIVF